MSASELRQKTSLHISIWLIDHIENETIMLKAGGGI